jgi:succinate dehydrogenase subunit C
MSMGHTPYHPRWHRERVSVWWWLGSARYARFVLRELTSVFVAFFALVTLAELRALGRGPEAHARFLELLSRPWMVGLNALALAFVAFHTVTWFNLAPRAMPVRVGGRRLPDALVAGANYAAWLFVSAAIAFFLLRR